MPLATLGFHSSTGASAPLLTFAILPIFQETKSSNNVGQAYEGNLVTKEQVGNNKLLLRLLHNLLG